MKESVNFKNVFLSSRDLDILSKASCGSIITTHPAAAEFLTSYGFISQYPSSERENEFVITPLGIQYLEYLDFLKTGNTKEQKRLKIAEIRSWIAILISLIALIKSFFLSS
ncbi:hypothetical protein [Lacrimispora sp.]|uniref:hypothetical protein n=1 Tax=Lacrimispora sp. TaxID=2719234 RepID=UPI00285828EA|nr:hypothetical protein [Lacrimispora sp.]MDR7814645.1 hypothetical protein [Lacrimispora sp.]